MLWKNNLPICCLCWILIVQSKGIEFQKPELNATYLDKAFIKTVKYRESQCFGATWSPDDFEAFIKNKAKKATNCDKKRRVNELKTLRNLHPYIGQEALLRIDSQLENADLSTDTKHPLILLSRHLLMWLVVLSEHFKSGHAGLSYMLMKMLQWFWVIYGIKSVKSYFADYDKSAMHKAKPVQQLMVDLPECRLIMCNIPFKFCSVDYLGPYFFWEGCSNWKAWCLLFTCLCTWCRMLKLWRILIWTASSLHSLALQACEGR